MTHSFDPHNWSHWLLIAAYVGLSVAILKAVYFS